MANYMAAFTAHRTPLTRKQTKDNSLLLTTGVSCKIDKGNGSISGIVLEKGVPVSRRVMLYERVSGTLFGQTQSNSTGHFTFDKTKEDLTYFAISLDETQDEIQYNLAGKDLLSGDFDRMGTL